MSKVHITTKDATESKKLYDTVVNGSMNGDISVLKYSLISGRINKETGVGSVSFECARSVDAVLAVSKYYDEIIVTLIENGNNIWTLGECSDGVLIAVKVLEIADEIEEELEMLRSTIGDDIINRKKDMFTDVAVNLVLMQILSEYTGADFS